MSQYSGALYAYFICRQQRRWVTGMLYVVAHLFIAPGMDASFHEYEQRALNIFQSHGGELILACRPEAQANPPSSPSEIHILQIGSGEAFRQFQDDPRLIGMQEWRREVLQRTELFFSSEPVNYRSDV